MSPSHSWKRSQASFVVILLANLTSLAVVWWYDWQAHALLIGYWLETGVVGAVSVAKILRAEGADDPSAIRSWTNVDGESPDAYVGQPNRAVADAFVRNYVWLWLFAGVFLAIIPFAEEMPLEVASPSVVALAAVGLVASHVFSYWYEYVGKREYEHRGPVSLLVEPAPRFWALMLTLIFGLGATSISRSPVGAIAVLVVFKTSADLLAHRRERKRAVASE
ncbi:DUF6498-containing protein [Natronoglomus mannanivorans]|uniref:DUF6498-containing protein n=1 Tax=Natronoglomus mannanivorans TaxID=2979990 RepID=A0AAP2Z2D8_9EURY|nr:DUF6498-containing protein [Halobacteria archaeon AArc-xg1-1]